MHCQIVRKLILCIELQYLIMVLNVTVARTEYMTDRWSYNERMDGCSSDRVSCNYGRQGSGRV